MTEELHGELRTLRDKLSELTSKIPENKALVREMLKKVQVGHEEVLGLDDETIEALTEFLYPISSGIDIKNKTLIINVPMVGAMSEAVLSRYYVYAEFLKGLGAAHVVFLPKGVEITELSDEELEKKGLIRRT